MHDGKDGRPAWACSCVAVWQNGRAEIVTNEHGGRRLFTDTERLVGDAAKSQASWNPTNTVFATKRLMGRRFSDASVQDGLKLWPFKVVPGRGDKPMVAASYKGKQKLLIAEEPATPTSAFKAEHKKDVGHNTRAMVRLRAACKQAKRMLSLASWAAIELELLHDGADFYSTITRDQFGDLNLDLFCKCLEPIKKCLAGSKMDRSSVDDVVLVGGSSRIPRVRHLIQDLFNGKELRKDISLEEAAALDAATMGRRGSGDSLLDLFRLLDATLRSLGVEAAGGAMAVMIPKNVTIPVRVREKTISIQPHDKKGVVISVFEGERPQASENTLLGELELPGAHNKAKPGVKLSVSVLQHRCRRRLDGLCEGQGERA